MTFVNPYSLYPNQTNFDYVRNLGEKVRLPLDSLAPIPSDERKRILSYLKLLNDWVVLVYHSPALRTLTSLRATPLRMATREIFGYFEHPVFIDGVTKVKRCIRLGTDEVFVKRRVLRDGLILGSVDEFVLGRIYTFTGRGSANPETAIEVGVPYQRFAIKNYLFEKLANKQENMEKELTIQRRMTETKNPNVLPLLEYLSVNDRCMAIFPLIELGDLFDNIPELSTPQCKILFRSMLQGTLALHALGFAHRDISPENFLLKDESTALLMDFGLATEMDEDWMIPHTGHVGKASYAPPELYASRSEVPSYDGRKVDVWSLGITLFVMIVKNFPWNQACRADSGFLKKIRHLPEFLKLRFKEEADTVLIDMFIRMFRVDPKERPRVDELLEHPWLTGA